jgi:hypothetical protein
VVVVVRVVKCGSGGDAAVTLRLDFWMPEFAALRPRQGYLCCVGMLLVSDLTREASNSWKMLGTGSFDGIIEGYYLREMPNSK